MEKCINGKCDLKNQTTDEVLKFMSSKNKLIGSCFYLFVDEGMERKMRKDIIKDITYLQANQMAEGYGDDMQAFKFMPYGYNEDFDKVVEKMVDGPFEAQLPE